jgi:hypothetical protein
MQQKNYIAAYLKHTKTEIMKNFTQNTENQNAKRQTRKVGVAGGFINQMMGNNTSEPVVGQGATLLSYSDRHAYETIWVSDDGLECKIRKMICTFVGSGYGDERYTYESDPEGSTYHLRWNPKRNKWQKVFKVVKMMKARLKELQSKYGVWKWTDGLMPEFGVTIDDITYNEDDPQYNPASAYYQYKLIPGITREYEEKYDVSVIFGIMDEYRDPSF